MAQLAGGCYAVPAARCLLDSNPFFDPRRQRFVLQLFKGGESCGGLL